MAKKDSETPATKPAATKSAAAKPAAKAAAATATASDAPAAPRKPRQPVAVAGPDSFVDRLQPHIKKIAAAAVAIAVVIGGWVLWRYLGNRAAAKSTDKLAKALRIPEAEIVPAGKTPTPPDPNAPPTAEPAQTFPTAQARAEAAAEAFADTGKVAKKTPLYQAALDVDAGKLDDAEQIYKDHAGDDGLDGVLAREGEGYVLEARATASKDAKEQQSLYAQALDAYKQMQPDAKGPRADYALYHQARMLAQLGKRAEAKAALDQALKAVPDSDIKTDIEARQALLEGP